ncbi:MAG TPA: vitamin K epoxide reductase family protein [Candidatus Limnocylindria bacterium]|nr:vitamin K epoxide reductase family protein [Candidatus Limnocylindria bacterium]
MTRAAAALVAGIGTLVSAYLTWVHYSGDLALCTGFGGCEAVQTSRFSMVGVVPVALIGLAGFIAILTVALLRLRDDTPDWAEATLFGLSLAATLYVAYLTYIELFVLGAVCPWCVAVALCAALVLALVSLDLFRPPRRS